MARAADDTFPLKSAGWTLVAVVDSTAYLTNSLLDASLALDVTRWPPRITKREATFTRAVAGGASVAKLVGWSQQKVVVGKRSIALPAKKYGYRAIGSIATSLVLVPGHLGRDNQSSPLSVGKTPIAWTGAAWTPLRGDGGPHTQLAGVTAQHVIFGGHICALAGDELVRVGELPRADGTWLTQPVDIDGGFAMPAGALAVWRDNKLALHRVADASVVRVLRDGQRLLLRTAGLHGFWSFDLTKGRAKKLVVDVDADELIPTPAGTLALVANGAELRRV